MLKHKLQQVMLERDAGKRLTGRVEIDDAYLGGEAAGGKQGRGAAGKTPFVAAVETAPDRKPVRLKLRRIDGVTGQAISRFALRSLDHACTIVSDGLKRFTRVSDAGCTHQPLRTGSGPSVARTRVIKKPLAAGLNSELRWLRAPESNCRHIKPFKNAMKSTASSSQFHYRWHAIGCNPLKSLGFPSVVPLM